MVNKKRDKESDQFAEEYRLETFLNVLDKFGPTGTTDASAYIDYDIRIVHLKFQSLGDDSKVTSRRVGNALP
ncbi:hypothetical protein SAMN05192561_10767 [Halopenitus malekzadehii]|uniref:Uncharacterized protein n=1 Tax=Halopenitus malekzadehii TaxID=1267564 RepID=A0A1H6JBH5_9EURY|nr:hypothetical protein [Halopenitus malekzadehii]SEH56346.1 hypothetical protein SAMN05192561_10767 [Halopenitus malekzadehii]